MILLSVWLLPPARVAMESRHLDLWGAVTVTAGMLVAVYAVVGGNEFGWLSARTLGLLGGAAALLGGYHATFLVGALFAAGAGIFGGLFLRTANLDPSAGHGGGHGM